MGGRQEVNMVLRTVLMDESADPSLQRAREAGGESRGLLIGNLSASRGHVLAVIPFPEEEGNEGGVASPDWVADHCRNSSRMLPGGVTVVGVYVISQKIDWKAAWFTQAVSKLKSVQPAECGADRLVLHCDARTGEYKMKCHNGGSDCVPCTFRTASFLNKAVLVTAEVALDVSTDLPAGGNADTVLKGVLEAVRPTCSAIRTAIAVPATGPVAGSVLSADAPVTALFGEEVQSEGKSKGKKGKAPKSEAQSTGPRVAPMQLLVPLAGRSSAHSAGVRISGGLHARALVMDKTTMEEAVTALREDAVRSLHDRLQLLCDDLDSEDQNPLREGAVAEQVQLQLPKRVCADCPLFATDYVLENEDVSDCVDRFDELLGLQPPGAAAEAWLTDCERFRTGAPTQSEKKLAAEGTKSDANDAGTAAAPDNNLPMLIGGIVVLLAVVGGALSM